MLFILPVTTGPLAAQYDSPDSSSSDSPPLISSWQLPPAPTMTLKMSKRRSFSKKCKIPICAKHYTVAELQLATSNFSLGNLLGEGTLGSVYRADFPDGQVYPSSDFPHVTKRIFYKVFLLLLLLGCARFWLSRTLKL